MLDDLCFIDLVVVYLVCVSLGLLYYYGFFLSALILIFSVLAETLARKSVFDMTCLVSVGMLNFNSINQVDKIYFS